MRRPVTALAAALLALQPVALAAAAAPADATAPSAGMAYQPQDADERGLWLQVDEAERQFKASPLIVRDPALNDYVRGVLCRTVGADQCRDIRLYIVRTPHFNATMSPNGMMQVWTGLILRTQNEAQLAAVLGHEFTHYQNRHSLKLFRDLKSKSASAAWLAFTGIGLIASFGLAASYFKYSRAMEQEADTGGVGLMAAAGYDTREAAKIWEQLREEMDATAAARATKSRKDKEGGLFASHPPTAERVKYLVDMAAGQPGAAGATGADRHAAALARWRPEFIDDQLKTNDFGASEYLLGSLARDGWAPWLLYARGELFRRRAAPGDLDAAVRHYTQGIDAGGDLPELWRGRGLARLKLGEADAGRADLGEYVKRAPGASDRAMMEMMAGGI